MPAVDARAVIARMPVEDRRAIIDFLVDNRRMTPQAAEAGLAQASLAELDRLLIEMRLATSVPLHTFEYQPYER